MGCVSSKRAATSSPPFEPSSAVSAAPTGGSFWERTGKERSEAGELGKGKSKGKDKGKDKAAAGSTNLQSVRLGNLYKYIEGEQVAAGWPSWLTAVSREAIYGWVPLRAESYEKLEKIGQGTYSSVFKARDLDTGRIVALKKVRFDNFEPESVRFMTREIVILRRLDHPNVMKLEGLITSRMSSSIYLVFQYMDHDLAGLTSSPEIKFSESQVKCYMHQLLSGLDHCHSRGIMHRDIKCANLLVNNEGILKIADFGLANFYDPEVRQPLTSRVVTLWYRPPELILGATDYEPAVDLWSVGCVFAEIFIGKPVLQGRTEVEQIHRIFKLCGSPPDDYWKKNKLPHATLFRPQQPYEKCLRERFKYLPESAYNLLDTLLSVDPYKRGTPKGALSSEYFKTKPYACEPSSLPKYSPNKEMDAKNREDSRRRRFVCRENGQEATRRVPSRTQTAKQPTCPSKLPRPEDKWKKTYSANYNGAKQDLPGKNEDRRLFVDLQPKPSIYIQNEAHAQSKQTTAQDVGVGPFSGPLPASNFSGLIWAKKQKEGHTSSKACSSKQTSSSSSVGLQPKNTHDFKSQAHADAEAMLKKWIEAGEHHRTDQSSER